jgi:mono/diheme cytochrome c family protein
MSKRPFFVFGIFALICVVAVPWIALGKNGDQDAATVKVASRDQASKDLFATNCGPCHTLAAAGTDGVVGPNLDELLVPSGINSAESFPANAGRVMQAVTCGVEGRMPKGILEEEEAKQAATFVAAYAGQIGKGPVVDTDSVKPPEQPTSCG